jgi:hypothetical protein
MEAYGLGGSLAKKAVCCARTANGFSPNFLEEL